MTALILISLIAIIYALNRAKHDSFIRSGPWKKYAFIEGMFFDVCIVSLSVAAFGLAWWLGFVLAIIFAFVFWLFFDCAVGWHFSGSILYLGNSGFDLEMREIFKYNYRIFGWESGALFLILFKSIWIALSVLAYTALL